MVSSYIGRSLITCFMEMDKHHFGKHAEERERKGHQKTELIFKIMHERDNRV